jgi:transcriptional antiterminator NusG
MSPSRKKPPEDKVKSSSVVEPAIEAGDDAELIDAVEAQPQVEIPAGAEWYVIHSYSGYENKVRQNLGQRIESMGMQNKIFRVVVPTEEEVEIRDGKKRSSRKRVFPGYILVHMVLDEESWYVVRNTPGVTGFVGSGTAPTPLREDEVDKILKRMEEETPRIRVNFRIGEPVRIVEGPFADFVGVVDEIFAERGKVRVLVSFFGRETPVEMDFLQVDKT